jgi:hypothetical protein
MPQASQCGSLPSGRAAEAIGRFASFVSALDEGRLRQADRERSHLKQLGFAVDVRPLGRPSQINREGASC